MLELSHFHAKVSDDNFLFKTKQAFLYFGSPCSYDLHNMKEPKTTTNVTYVFSQTTLLDALKEWELEQIEHFPQQQERIQITVLAMQHFLRSQQVKDHKMIVSGEPDSFAIEMPVSIFDSASNGDSEVS